jgi:DNA-directed RNA polymerase subunit F
MREVDEAIQEGLLEEWKERLEGMSKEQIEKELLPLQEKKNLTEPELLVIYNLAPTCVEQVQSMVENSEERFSMEECQAILDVILRVLRPDEKRLAT